MKANEFAKKLKDIYDNELVSIVIYGTNAKEGDYSKKYSDINLIVVLKKIIPAQLIAVNKLIKQWIKSGNPSPLFFDLDHIKTSLDVFPLEFLDIRDRHKVLIGDKDLFKNLKIELKNLRHQCESELKGVTLHLNSFYAANCNKPKHVASAVMKTWPGVRTVFRGLFYLLEQDVPNDPKEIIEKLNASIDFNPQVFFDVIAIRDGSEVLPRKNGALEFAESYLTELATITNFVDKY